MEKREAKQMPYKRGFSFSVLHYKCFQFIVQTYIKHVGRLFLFNWVADNNFGQFDGTTFFTNSNVHDEKKMTGKRNKKNTGSK